MPVTSAPRVTDDDVTFVVATSPGVTGVALDVDRSLGGRLPFELRTDSWVLRYPRPDVQRLEYRLVISVVGSDEWCTDPSNPLVVPGPFGARSEIRFPDYAPPEWLDTSLDGELRSFYLSGPRGETVPTRLFTPAGLPDDVAAPLVVAHDGTDFADRGSLLRWACSLPHPVRVVLLDPAAGLRNAWYAADPDYARHVANELLPAVALVVAVSKTVGLGASLGALAMVAIHQFAPFDALALQSGSFFRPAVDGQESQWPEFRQVCTAVARWSIDAGRPVPTLVAVGTVEENRTNNEQMARSLSAQGFAVTSRLFRDGHNMIAWRDSWNPDLGALVEAVG